MFTDLHCHLLYGVDDGPKDPAGSVAIAKLLVSLGFGTVAATPHALPQFADASACAARRDEVQALLAREGVPLALQLGAENRLDEAFIAAELSGQGRHYAKTAYVLVEAPYESVVPALPDLLFRLSRKGVRPVLAHPERCAEFQELPRAEEAVRLGATLQLDLGSLSGTYGRQAKKTAQRLLEAGLYSIASSDVHEAESAAKWLREGIRELEKRAGRAGLERLLDENPARLLRGEELS
ncbi:MAG TPA: CpsB/CapC family capsule biosynthesis tyrosine phosphatase [Myxococcales bacterium]|jgi:protein-tyrosine phosphatase